MVRAYLEAIEGKTPKMRKLFVLIAAMSLFVAACGGDSDGGASCESVADDAISLFQDVINEMDSMSDEDLASGDEPAALTELESKSDELQTRANDLGCSDEEMEELLTARIGDLTSDGLFGELMISELENGGLFGG